MKLLAFLIPFFLLICKPYLVFGNIECEKIPNFKYGSIKDSINDYDKILSSLKKQDAKLTFPGGQYETTNSIESFLSQLACVNDQITEEDCVKNAGAIPYSVTDPGRTSFLFCIVPVKAISNLVTKGEAQQSLRLATESIELNCIQAGGKWEKNGDGKKKDGELGCNRLEEFKCTGDKSITRPKKYENLVVEKNPLKYFDHVGGQWRCIEGDPPLCETLDPSKDCAPKRTQNLTDVFIQGLGFMSAKSGNRCIALAVQSFPATRAYSNAVKKCTKQTKIACKKNKEDGKPQCKSCKDYKEQLEHVQAEQAKMIFAYEEAINCAKQTKTDYNGSAEECNIVTTLNRDKCCFMPEHMNNAFCDDFGSEHSYSPNTGYVDNKGVAGVDGLDYMDDGLPFVSPQTKFDPSNPDYSPGFNPSDSSGPVGGGAGGSPYTGDNSGISGLGKKGLFKSYMQGASNRWGSNSKKNNKYYPSFSSSSKRNLKFKNNKNNKNGKNIKRSIASKRNRTIFERISDVYTSLVNKKKLFFKKGEK